MKKNFHPISKQDFQQSNKSAGECQQPSPEYLTSPSEFEKLVYVAAAFNKVRPKSKFNHSNTSPFQLVTSCKK